MGEETGKKQNPSHFKPGQSGNPNGRPLKGETMTDLLRSYMDEIDPTAKKKRKEVIIEKFYNMAKKDKTSLTNLFNRMDGMPRQPITGNNEDDPIAVMVNINPAKPKE